MPWAKSIHSPRPREARVADRAVGAGIAAGPAVVPGFPSRVCGWRIAGRGWRGSCSFSMSRAASSTPSTVPNRPAWPAAPPRAKAFSSCTSPRMTRPRQVQRSVAAHVPGSGRNDRPGRRGWSSRGRPRQALDGDAEQDEVDVGVDGRTRAPTRGCRTNARKRRRVLAVGVERFDGGEVGSVGQALAEGEVAFGRIGGVLPQVRDCYGQLVIQRDASLGD